MEKIAKRKVWHVLLSAALTVSVLLSGCGGGSNTNKAPDKSLSPELTETTDTPEPVETAPRPVLGLTYDNDYHYDDARGEIVNSMQTELPGADAATRAEYPELSDALDRFRETALASAKAAYQEREAALPDIDAVQALGGQVRSMIRRADAQAVSFVNYWWDYSGGAHGNYGYGAANFDTATGTEITLDNLLTDEGRLTINSRLGQELDALYTELTPGGMIADYLLDDYTFSLEPDGVTFWFNPYEIASYADGVLSAKLYFDRDADILKSDYKGQEEAWFVELGTETPYRFASGDAFRTVEAWNIIERDSTDWYSGFGVEFDAPEDSNRWAERITSADDETDWMAPEERNIILDRTGYFDAKFYYAHIPEGDYVTAVLSMENDVTETIVYRADGAFVQTLDMTGPESFMYPELPQNTDDIDWSQYNSYHLSLTDPYDTPLGTRFYLFGTWTGVGAYCLTADGFQPVGDLLYHTGEYVLTLKQDLTVTRCSFDDSFVSTEEDFTLPAGTNIQLLAVDGAENVYFRAVEAPETFTEDVDFVFALCYNNPDEWPRTVDGVEETDIFDGLMYAG
ncbi:MAG: DUF3298 domain-containing protein [Oscillospiraceae bacterium]|nr:DUF3298 domain-containing protein [Oscillospiraceae bacterium]